MNTENTTPVEPVEDDEAEVSEEQMILDDLKNRAEILKIKFHPSIGADKLREKIQTALDENASEPVVPEGGSNTKKPDLVSLKNAALKLIHVRITCMDPMKKEFQGDYFTTGNSLVGTIKRFVPFGVEWHVPQILFNLLNEKKYQMLGVKKDSRGVEVPNNRMVKTYAIEILEPMSEKELKELAQRQAMAQGQAA